jgi:exodeoxyribonuclease VII small subunit
MISSPFGPAMTVLTDRVAVVTDGADAGPSAGPPKGSETLSYEQARDKLAAVVKRLEAGGLTLQQSLELWERGERLATVCGEWLDGARARLAAAMAARDDTGKAEAGDDAPF